MKKSRTKTRVMPSARPSSAAFDLLLCAFAIHGEQVAPGVAASITSRGNAGGASAAAAKARQAAAVTSSAGKNDSIESSGDGDVDGGAEDRDGADSCSASRRRDYGAGAAKTSWSSVPTRSGRPRLLGRRIGASSSRSSAIAGSRVSCARALDPADDFMVPPVVPVEDPAAPSFWVQREAASCWRAAPAGAGRRPR